MRIGIFDSGIGGEAIAKALAQAIPTAELLVVNDKEHVPYGDRQPDEIVRLTDTAIQPLLDQKCDVIVLACNTATAVAINILRDRYPSQKFVGIEPMVKPAARISQTKIIAVCATPTTLNSEHFTQLVKTYADDCTIVTPDCRKWARMIEQNSLNESHIENVISEIKRSGADVIVLGCTHYHWIKEEIIALAGPSFTILEPSEAISRRVKELLATTVVEQLQ